MAGVNRPSSFVIGVLVCAVLILQISCQKLQECKKTGDYLWKKSSANKFYFCYKVQHAMAMECLDNRYMCKVPGKVFGPCMCIRRTGENANEAEPQVSYDVCDEKFRYIPATDVEGGELQQNIFTDEGCSTKCLNMVHCLAYAFDTNSNGCRIFLPSGKVPQLREGTTGMNYYVKKACSLKFGYKHRSVDISNGDDQTKTTPNPNSPESQTAARSGPTDVDVEGKTADEENPYAQIDYSEDYTTPATPQATTTTIPDSGCPYGLQKFENMSHQGGVLLKHIDHIESCKSWCLNVGYCKGVDFDEVLNLCYYHRVIVDEAVQSAENVWHIRKLHCQPPLKCWSQISYNSSNVDPSTPQIPCQGVCFVREKIFNSYSVFERGCHASRPAHTVGCEVDGALTGLTCFCNTDRCNGLSISALAAIMLHLPLDGDSLDHSGLGRDGQAALGYNMPQISCLEKAINCSMMFTGQECIEVTQMASQAWGEVDLQNEFHGMFTVSVWFKTMETNVATVQGITGNSWDASVRPTWSIQTSNVSTHLVTATIETQAQMTDSTDFPYVVASPGEWHHIAVVYNAEHNVDALEFPVVRVFLDGVEQPGNMHNDFGNILVRRQPVTVGCVSGKGFAGFVDDLRIFGSALNKADIESLLQMNDGLYQ